MNATRKRATKSAEQRFSEKIAQAGVDECWRFTAAIGNHGYGVFHPTKGETVLAHRYSYERTVGPIPEGMHLDHLCRNRQCVNPGHLEAVTPLENSSRGLTYRLLNGMDDECRNGHPYTPENTYVEPNGYKVRCRQCARDRDAQPHRNAATRRRRYAQEKAA